MKYLALICLVVCFSQILSAQNLDPFNKESGNQFDGGFGVTWIDGKSYTTFTIAPELSIGKFGAGLNLELLFDNSNGFKFRKIGWEKGAGALRMIRYLRWGIKHDPLYVRVGSLQSATIGHGFIMGYYSNAANYDSRKIGLEFDIDFKSFGFESMTSNLGNLEVVGGRLYYRPLSSTNIPIIKNFEVGSSYVTDVNPDNRTKTKDGISEWGVDIGLPIIQTQIFNTTIYADYAKIPNFGDGKAVGIMGGFPDVLGLIGINAKYEYRFLNDQFLPNYFNMLYEMERNELPAEYYGFYKPGAEPPYTKKEYLSYAEKTNGIFGELSGHILGKILLLGNYQKAIDVERSGILHLEARSADLIPGVQLRYTYDKVGIETFKDARTLDYRSVAVGEIGYRAYQFILVGLQWRWNFVYNEEKDAYEPQERFQPKIGFSMNF
jgi:hypothetical protein